jgi:hypothetical protein
LAPRSADRRLGVPHCRLSDSRRRPSDVRRRPEMRVGGLTIRICVSPQRIGARKCSSAARLKPSAARPSAFALRKDSSPARRFPLPGGNALRRLRFPHFLPAHRHWRTEMPIGGAPMASGEAPIPIGGRKCSSGRRQSRSARLRSALPRLPSAFPRANAHRERGNAGQRDGNAFCRGSNRHFHAEMPVGEWEMRFAGAPMGISAAPKRICARKCSWPRGKCDSR